MLFWEGGKGAYTYQLHLVTGAQASQAAREFYNTKMKLSTSLLLPTIVGAAAALSNANVYIFQRDSLPTTSNPPTLTPEQARLIFAQRLGTSRYHGLGDASESTLSYINSFGGPERSLFEDAADDRPSELVLIVEGVSSKSGKQDPLIAAYSGIKPAFAISKAPSMTANKQLASDINQQCGQAKKSCALVDAINPFDVSCWNGKSKVIHFDLVREKFGMEQLISVQERLIRFAENGEMNVVVVLMPESSRSSKSPANPYGRYEKVSQSPIGRRQAAEEPMIDDQFTPAALRNKQAMVSNSSDNSTFEPITGVPQLCHSSLDACNIATNNCSGHGSCYKKYGNAKDVGDTPSSCFACGCVPTKVTFSYAGGSRQGWTLQYWGGSACQKRDVSGPFWLITIFSVVMIGLVGWGIGLLFSIGEEKLPGVIGAGVSSKTR